MRDKKNARHYFYICFPRLSCDKSYKIKAKISTKLIAAGHKWGSNFVIDNLQQHELMSYKIHNFTERGNVDLKFTHIRGH